VVLLASKIKFSQESRDVLVDRKSQKFFGFDQLSRYFLDIFDTFPTVRPDHQTCKTTTINRRNLKQTTENDGQTNKENSQR